MLGWLFDLYFIPQVQDNVGYHVYKYSVISYITAKKQAFEVFSLIDL